MDARLFQADPETEGIVMIGEIGGTAGEEAAAFAQENIETNCRVHRRKLRRGKTHGYGRDHRRWRGTAAEKMKAGWAVIHVVKSPADIGAAMKEAL